MRKTYAHVYEKIFKLFGAFTQERKEEICAHTTDDIKQQFADVVDQYAGSDPSSSALERLERLKQRAVVSERVDEQFSKLDCKCTVKERKEFGFLNRRKFVGKAGNKYHALGGASDGRNPPKESTRESHAPPRESV